MLKLTKLLAMAMLACKRKKVQSVTVHQLMLKC